MKKFKKFAHAPFTFQCLKMSDRSFGDHTNRNVVKNPLLSSAVIGLSIDDLTQNAVLLPAIPSQELNTRQG